MISLSSRKPLFWILLGSLSLISVAIIYNYFSRAFPIVNVDITMNRHQALDMAKELALKNNWGPQSYHEAASFDRNAEVQFYVELEAGGHDAFAKMLTSSLFSPFTWHVRHFKEGEANETEIFFKPNGEFYGFNEKIAESEPGAHLHSVEARTLAEDQAVKNWGIKLDEYSIIETSKEERQNGRIDHTFVYERPTIVIGEGRYRLLLKVTGDKLTQLQHFIKIPQGFYLRYEEMRSFNKNIYNIGYLFLLFYQLLAALGLFFLLRQGWVIIKQPLILSIILALLSFANSFNELPLVWMYYDTALGNYSFLLQYFLEKFFETCKWFLMYLLTITAAESLSRKAFGKHIQLCKSWTLQALNSYQVLGRIVGGYLYALINLAIIMATYFVGRMLGMWAPADSLVNPNILATYMPWLSPFKDSFHAGVWEECLFRAVPLSCIALLGARFNKRTMFIALGIVLQAIIFGAVHANYPQQPSYARILEIFLPSVMWAIIYLIWGLIPVIIIHFLYDISLMSLPIFLSSAWLSQFMVIFLGALPLCALAYGRIKSGSWKELPHHLYNAAWKPLAKHRILEEASFTISKYSIHLTRIRSYFIMGAGILAALALIYAQPWKHDDMPLDYGPFKASRMSRSDALLHADLELQHQGIHLSDSWKKFAMVVGQPETENRFIWETEDRKTYQQLSGLVLKQPRWIVRYAPFDGPLEDKAEEYYIILGYSHAHSPLIRFFHRIPEHNKGEHLTESQARSLTSELIKKQFSKHNQFNDLPRKDSKEISASPSKLPHRTDWTFTYVSPHVTLKDGDVRTSISMTENKITDINQFVHVPEAWGRQDRDKQSMILTCVGTAGLVQGLILLLIILFIFFTGQFSLPAFGALCAFFICLTALQLMLSWPVLIFNLKTSQPIAGQLFRIISSAVISTLSQGASHGLLLSFIVRHTHKLSPRLYTLGSAISFGIIYKAILVITTLFGSLLAPHWAKYDAASYYLPSLGTALILINSFASVSLFATTFVLMLNYFGRQLHWWVILLLSLIFGIISSSVTLSLSLWLAAGILLGILFFVAYRHLLGQEPRLCFIMYATTITLSALTEMSYHAYPGAVIGNLLGICGIWALCYYMVNRK